jgi:ketosteroid isomerase-like protein
LVSAKKRLPIPTRVAVGVAEAAPSLAEDIETVQPFSALRGAVAREDRSMRKAKAVTRTRSAFVAALTTACVFGTASYAQSDMDRVKAAVDAYHAALSALDAVKMESLWAHDDSVMDIEPSAKAITFGWDAVKKNFEAEFNALSELKVTQADGPHVQVKGDVAWSTGVANADAKLKSGPAGIFPTFETDVFEKRGGVWLLVSHTASGVPK